MRRVLPALLLVLGLVPSAQAAPFSVGSGQNAGIAVDDGGTTYELRRRHARIPVRVIPRRDKARTLRLRVRRCGATR